MKQIIFLLFSVLIFSLQAQNSIPVEIYNSNWSAVDALGRQLPGPEETGSVRPDKYVGVFYFLWHGFHESSEIYDISKLIAANPDNPQYGPHYAFHWWGEPEAGYYRALDPWVIRRNLQMLTDAGVDFLYIDVTNAFTYLDEVYALCDVSLTMREEGMQTPYIVFTTHTSGGQTINNLYDNFYSKSEYRDLWFIWQGKPLILGDINDPDLYPEAKEFFTFRYSWAWTDTKNHPHHWQWLDRTPQDYGWDTDPAIAEQIPVSVAEHPYSNIGASFHNGSEPPRNSLKLTDYTGQGLHFQEQWDRALEVDPQVVMVTGWNEWIAQKMINGQDNTLDSFIGEPLAIGADFFVDAYNEEYNRDVEPMKGGHTDNRYYQMVANIRRFKGMPAAQTVNDTSAIRIDGNFDDWSNVIPVFKDPRNDTFHRNYPRYDEKAVYTNNTGRNDIIESRSAYDSHNIYFYVKTAQDLTPHTDPNWMLLFINTDNDMSSGWEGYDYLINKEIDSTDSTSISVWRDSNWVKIGKAFYTYSGSRLELQIEKSLISESDSTPNFLFHWTDNIQKLNDINEFFINGESAPDRRFSYNYSSSSGQTPDTPAAPGNLVAKAVSHRQINLSWTDNADNERGFIIEHSQNPDSGWIVVDTTAQNQTFYSDTTLESNKTYFFRVRAYNDSGSSPFSNKASATTFINSAPAAPDNLTAAYGDKQIDLHWSDNSDNESSFIVEKRSKNDSTWTVIAETGMNKTNYADRDIYSFTTYYYRVTAANSIGLSAYSDSAEITTGNIGNTWDFDNGTEGWSNASLHISGFGWENGGYISGTITGPDPYIVSENNLNIDIESKKYIIIKMKNASPSSAAQIYFTTNASPNFSEAQHLDFSVQPSDDSFETYVVNMSLLSSWKGILKQLRVDPAKDVNSGSFVIDYINISTSPSDIKNSEQAVLPHRFRLKQNYPNPFNPSTIIAYEVDRKGLVNLSVYNIRGQRVKTVVNKTLNPGYFTAKFEANNLSSGIYIYTLTTTTGKASKKMLLLR